MVGPEPGGETVRVVTDTVVPGAGVVTRVTVWAGVGAVVAWVDVVGEALVVGAEPARVAVVLVTDAAVDVVAALVALVDAALEVVDERVAAPAPAANHGLAARRPASALATSKPPAAVTDAVVELARATLAAVGGRVVEEDGVPLPHPAPRAAVAIPAATAATAAASLRAIRRVHVVMSTGEGC